MTRAAWCFLAILPLGAQEVYDLLLKNGHVIDPKNKRNERFDIAIAKGQVRKVAKGIPAAHARRVVDASDYYVTPGLIDLSGHFGVDGVNVDHNALRSGVTTVVDSGSFPPKDFDQFQKRVISDSKTRVLAFVDGRGDAGAAAALAAKHPDSIVGVWGAGGTLAASDSLAGLRAGDILTRVYGLKAPPLTEARRKGVLLDAGHGDAGFWFRVAAPALRQGLLPDTISTGMDKRSLLLPRATMTNVMSKFLALGLTLEQVIERTTSAPARAIRRPALGSIEEGGAADLAVFELRKGPVAFLDSGHGKLTADRELRCVLTIRDGAVLWDSEGLSLTHWKDAGPYSNFK
ncbi:MAG: amidohydrolase family protein [Bryobacterales bacterium]|nr:amidohydrolase family protein [Bryobacterales bacterium]